METRWTIPGAAVVPPQTNNSLLKQGFWDPQANLQTPKTKCFGPQAHPQIYKVKTKKQRMSEGDAEAKAP